MTPFADAVSLSLGIDPLAHLPLHFEPDIDLFAGGGGASTGFEQAFGKSPDLAVNHDPEALAMHSANHPDTVHLCQNVINVHPLQATGGRLVRCLWASPDCTHFSKAKGGRPRNQNIRDLAWTVIRWLEHTRPLLFGIENVEEFKQWGPLDSSGQPIKERTGETFRAWVKAARRLGYSVSWRELSACDYGAPTTRKRLFVIGRLDKKQVRWPAPTHGPGRGRPWRTAAECINWSDLAPSIFERKKPLADNTQRRIAEGIRRYVLTTNKPFLVTYYGPKKDGDFRGLPLEQSLPTVTTENRFALVSPYIVQPNHTGGFRGQAVEEPLATATQKGSNCLVAPHLAAMYLVKMRGTNIGGPVDTPLHTISAQGRHHGLISASLIKYYSEGGQHATLNDPMPTATSKARFALQTAHLQQYNGCSEAQPLDDPMPTIPTRDRFGLTAATLCQYNGRSECQPLDDPAPTLLGMNKMGLVSCPLSDLGGRYDEVKAFLRRWGVIGPEDEATVVIDGVVLWIVDIGLRMLRPRELFTANGFSPSYKIAPPYNGRPLSATSQVKKCGNSVPPQFVTAVFQANKNAP